MKVFIISISEKSIYYNKDNEYTKILIKMYPIYTYIYLDNNYPWHPLISSEIYTFFPENLYYTFSN